MKLRVLAIGQDSYWLTAVQRATSHLTGIERAKRFSGDPLRYISKLPKARDNTIVLLEASGQIDIEGVVRRFIASGWKYTIVVAADISAKQAAEVLRQDQGYDYWKKTYDEQEIYRQVQDCIDEIQRANEPGEAK